MCILDADQRDDVASGRLVDLLAVESAVAKDFFDARTACDLAVFEQRYCHAALCHAASHTPDGVFPLERVVLQARHQHLKSALALHCRSRNFIDNRIENRRQICLSTRVSRQLLPRLAVTSDRIVDRVVQLRLVGRKLEKQIAEFVFNFVDAACWLVDFIDNHNRLQPEFERL